MPLDRSKYTELELDLLFCISGIVRSLEKAGLNGFGTMIVSILLQVTKLDINEWLVDFENRGRHVK